MPEKMPDISLFDESFNKEATEDAHAKAIAFLKTH